jgi:hypothetical protein
LIMTFEIHMICANDKTHKGKPYRVTMPDGKIRMLCEKWADQIPGIVKTGYSPYGVGY